MCPLLLLWLSWLRCLCLQSFSSGSSFLKINPTRPFTIMLLSIKSPLFSEYPHSIVNLYKKKIYEEYRAIYYPHLSTNFFFTLLSLPLYLIRDLVVRSTSKSTTTMLKAPPLYANLLVCDAAILQLLRLDTTNMPAHYLVPDSCFFILFIVIHNSLILYAQHSVKRAIGLCKKL